MGIKVVPNEIFTFRLDSRNPNEQEVIRLLREAKDAGQMREFIVECILSANGVDPVNTRLGDKTARKINALICRLETIVHNASNLGASSHQEGQTYEANTFNVSPSLARNVLDMIGNVYSDTD